MFENYSARINGRHTFADYGLYVTNSDPIDPPEARVQYLSVPGRNGEIDMTEVLAGYMVYGSRNITLELGGKKPAKIWPKFMTDFINELHGKRVQVIFDNEPEWYFEGRAIVEPDYQKGNEIARFTLTIKADPYRQSVLSSTEPWKWDPFSFVDGVIRSYSRLTVNGRTAVKVIGSEKPTIPMIRTSVPMKVEFEGKSYDLAAGENKVYDIVLLNKAYTLIFTGSGTVSIEYRAGRL